MKFLVNSADGHYLDAFQILDILFRQSRLKTMLGSPSKQIKDLTETRK